MKNIRVCTMMMMAIVRRFSLAYSPPVARLSSAAPIRTFGVGGGGVRTGRSRASDDDDGRRGGSAFFSSSSATGPAVDRQEEGGGGDVAAALLHPDRLGEIPYPKALSPSAAMEFKKCPQSFLLQYLYKIRQPKTTALAKGSMCHEALEKVFDLKPEDRDLENLQNLLRASWGESRFGKEYADLFVADGGGEGARDVEAERAWGQSALQLLENYYKVEDPRTIVRPNPLRREIWLHCHLAKDPSLGATSSSASSDPHPKEVETFYVRGIVDRIDMVRLPTNEVVLKVVDYKTGKAPDLKYSPQTNHRIVEEAFYQLKIYALLLRENGAGRAQPKGMELRFLQLFYLTSKSGDAKLWEYDLGETREERDRELNEVHRDLAGVWDGILRLVDEQNAKLFEGCDRSFCFCHKGREKFEDGSLWEPDG